MLVDLSNSELWDLLRDGTTNQKQFISDLDFEEFERVIDFLEEIEFKDIRGMLNGGVLHIVEEENENTCFKLDDDKFLEIL